MRIIKSKIILSQRCNFDEEEEHEEKETMEKASHDTYGEVPLDTYEGAPHGVSEEVTHDIL